MAFPPFFYAKDEVGLYPKCHQFIEEVGANTASYLTLKGKVFVNRDSIELYQLDYKTTLQATLNDLEVKVEKLKNIINE